MDEKDREIQELRRQVESTKIEPVRRANGYSSIGRTSSSGAPFAAGSSTKRPITARIAGRTCTSWRGYK